MYFEIVFVCEDYVKEVKINCFGFLFFGCYCVIFDEFYVED